jgi:ribulose-phosphate 3-epimerase
MAEHIKVAPSILAADFAALGDAVRRAEAAGADLIHVDVMDGRFVPNISFGQDMVRALKRYTSLPLDVHMMVCDADRQVPAFVEAGADVAGFHVEAARHPHRILQNIREAGARAAIALNPGTPLCMIEELLPDVDMVLLMTVNPGFGGQTLIPQMMEKLRRLRAMVDDSGYTIEIEIDGGCTVDNVQGFIEAGADIIVAGSAIFGAEDMGAMIRRSRGR